MTSPPGGLVPFLKWAGGKRWLSAALTPIIETCRGTYFEPFLGSGAVFFRHCPKVAVLSDSNRELINCYRAIRRDYQSVERSLRKLSAFEPGESYYQVRAAKPESEADRAARFLYLNRTCWNGLYRVNLKGDFNVPRGTKTKILLPSDDFRSVSLALSSVELVNKDFEAVIDRAAAGDVVFADPPYTVAHNLNGFVKYNQQIFTWGDQERLAAALLRAHDRGVSVLCTNADHQAILELYEPYFDTISVSRASVIAASSKNRKQTTELLISNTGINLA